MCIRDSFHSYSNVDHPEFKPYVRDYSLPRFRIDIPVSPTFAQWVAGKDPAMDAVLRWTP